MDENKINGNVRLPKHVGIIMDGNGRWAKKRLMPRSFGHKKGMDRMIGLMEHAFDVGINYITVYALSTENLNRPKEELDGLYNLIREHFAPCMRKICRCGVRLKILGDISLLPSDVQKILTDCEKETEIYSGKGVNIALAYGGRQEIVRAIEKIAKEGKAVSVNAVSENLYTAGQPEPDFIIRTGKELRLSNFLLWQSAYAELYFSAKMFPEFTNKDFDKAIKDFSSRTRRFGKTDEQIEGDHQ